MTGGLGPRRKGSRFENDVVNYLRAAGYPQAARCLAGATDDRGDVSGVGNAIIECKNCQKMQLGPWMDEAKSEALNAALPRYIVVHKRRGVSDPGESFATMPLWLTAELLREDS
jgi:hypothetical protein